MHPMKVKDELMKWTLENSGAEVRKYLGMSQIGKCPRELYEMMVNGREWSTPNHLMCYLRYLFERDMVARLRAIDEAMLGEGREFVDFDGRFKGHTDGEWDGELLEIKSTTYEKLKQIGEDKRLPKLDYWQVQCYMHYGQYEQATVIYVARDQGGMYVISVRRNVGLGERCVEKARMVLEAVEKGEGPGCECGYCGK